MKNVNECVSLSMTALQYSNPGRALSRHITPFHCGLFSNACWNAPFKVKKSVTPVAMTITMGATQTVLRVPKGTI